MKKIQLTIIALVCSLALSVSATPVEYPVSTGARSKPVSKRVLKAQEAQIQHFVDRINQGLNNKPMGLFQKISIVRRDGRQQQVKLDAMTKTLIIRVGKGKRSVVSAETIEALWQSGVASLGKKIVRLSKIPLSPAKKAIKLWNVTNPVSETRLGVRNLMSSLRGLLQEKMPKWSGKLEGIKAKIQTEDLQGTRMELSSLIKNTTTGHYISRGQTQSLRARALKFVETADLSQLEALTSDWKAHISSKRNQKAMAEATVVAAEHSFEQVQKAGDATIQLGNHHRINVSAVAGFGGKAKAYSRMLPQSESGKTNIKQEVTGKVFLQGLFTDNVEVSVAAAGYAGDMPRALTKAGLEHALNQAL